MLKNHLVKDVSVHFLLHFIHIYIYIAGHIQLLIIQGDLSLSVFGCDLEKQGIRYKTPSQ